MESDTQLHPESSNAMVLTSAVAPGLLSAVEPFIRNYIDQATVHSNRDVDTQSIFQDIEAGRMQLWVVFNESKVLSGCIITSLVKMPCQMICRFECIAGDREYLLELEKTVVQWARENGILFLEGIGRKGWTKKHSPGWKEVSRVYRKYIGN